MPVPVVHLKGFRSQLIAVMCCTYVLALLQGMLQEST
jgi:hypothetical protein